VLRHEDGLSGGRSWTRRDLHESEERFRLLVDSVVEYAIFMLDPDGMIATWNPGATRLKGYEPDEIIGQHYSVFYPPESRAEGLPDRLLAQALERGHTEQTGWRLKKDGSRFWADVVITALFDDEGRHTGFAKVTRDRTDAHDIEVERERALQEQRRLVTRLEELDAWRREFIGSVVHDLQTPVAAINGFVHLLREGQADDHDVPTLLDGVRSNTSWLQELIDNLRDYTVLTEPGSMLSRERFALAPFLTQLTAAIAPLLGERKVELDADDVDVHADRHGVERIVRNLLTNVARHTDDDTTVRIRGWQDGGDVVFEVADDGEGIPPELLSSLFDRFEHGGKGGTGLGLAVARLYAEMHDGTLTVDSTVGEGATFRLTLPEPDRETPAYTDVAG
jgi:PAS domain S-box-containing protein